jgi:Ni/Co efflux regulator RcnB
LTRLIQEIRKEEMKQLLTLIIVATVVTATSCLAQNSSSNLQRNLERLHNQWFNAFDKGDGATMDKLEVPNLILVNADGKGGIWQKRGPRAGKQSPTGSSTTLSNAQARQFGDSAILTGVVTTKQGGTRVRSSTTEVWIKKNNQWLIASAQWSDIRAAQ